MYGFGESSRCLIAVTSASLKAAVTSGKEGSLSGFSNMRRLPTFHVAGM